jgi:purine-binding chemotaxis protein CheW
VTTSREQGVPATVDWGDIRRRIDEAREGLRDSVRVTAEQAQLMLDQRARELARRPDWKRSETAHDALVFGVAGQRYAIESRFVVEVFHLADLALLPGAAPPVIGVVGWRGRLLTIMDLRAMLGLPTTALDDLGRVIVLGDERPEFGVLADTVEEITPLSEGDVRLPQRGIHVSERYVRGVALDAVLVLDAAELLRVDDDANNGESER